MVPKADTSDVSSPEAIVKALHESVNGPQGPWSSDRLRSLVLPNVILASVGPNEQGAQAITNVSLADFIQLVQGVHDQSSWYENEDKIIDMSTAHKKGGALAIVHYHGTAATTPGGTPVEDGDSIATLMWDGARWWVVADTF